MYEDVQVRIDGVDGPRLSWLAIEFVDDSRGGLWLLTSLRWFTLGAPRLYNIPSKLKSSNIYHDVPAL